MHQLMGLACSWPCKLDFSRNTNKNFNKSLDEDENFRRFPDAHNEELKYQTKRLESIKADLVGIIPADKRNNEMMAWINEVKNVCDKVNDLLSTKVSELKNDGEKVKFGYKVSTTLKFVEKLISERDKWDSYIITPEQSGPSTSSGTCKAVGLENKLSEMLDLIAGKEFSIIGILGAGGIGKTRLLEEISENFNNNHGNPTPRFTKVILVHVSKTGDLQKVIGEGLGISGFSGLKFKERKESLSKALSEEIYLIMLDDIWNGFNVHAIGIPLPKVNLNCKIVYTTRFKRCCTEMGLGSHNHKIVEMEYLDLEASLKLFKNARMFPSVGDSKIDNKIVRKCSGLPLALVTVGRATASGSPKYIYKAMSESPSDIASMEDDVLKVLKRSFDALTDEIRQRCFLFCGLFHDFKEINREQLLEYWIGEKLIGDNELLVRQREKATNHVENLVGSYLLDEAPDLKHVKMHNIVRSMAVWLANQYTDTLDENQGKDRFYVGEKFNHVVFEKMKKVERLSLMDVEIENEQVLKQAPSCPSLMTLLMALNDLRSKIQGRNGPRDGPWKYTIPALFFRNMPSIHVLDLTGHPIRGLPKAICDLKSLRYLNLSFTYIEMIPVHFNGLTNLRQLDLTGTSMLENIPFKAISSLSNLMSFKLYGSSYKISFTNRIWFRKSRKTSQLSLNDLEKLLCLQELSLCLQEIKILQRLSESGKLLKLTNCLQLACIRSVPGTTTLFGLLENFKNLKTLCLKNCDFKDETIVVPTNLPLSLKILDLRDLGTVRRISCAEKNGKSSLEGLWELRIVNCKELMEINCLRQLKCLQIFRIEACPNIVGFYEDKDLKMCLSQLKLLKLRHLPKLISISQSPVQIGLLKNMIIQQCSRLLNLPEFENQTAKIGVFCEKGWWYSLKGPNNNLQSLFKPHFLTTEPQTYEIQDEDRATGDQTAENQFEVKKDKGKRPLYPNPPPVEDVFHEAGPSQFGSATAEIVRETEVYVPEAQTTGKVQAIEAHPTEIVQAIEAQTEGKTADAQTTEILPASDPHSTDIVPVNDVQTEVHTNGVVQATEMQIFQSQKVTTAAA